jgi:hypothetical protein
MGANAQTAVPAFTAGQILTAVQQTQINTGIPVFATTVTRDAAFGGTGEKTLAEGQFAYIEATNTTQYYDGAAWQSVGVTPGLIPVVYETSVSAVSAINIDGIFSSTFQNYLIIANLQSSGADNLLVRLRVGGTSTTTNYGYQLLNADATAVGASRASAQSSATIGALRSATRNSIPLYVYAPEIAQWTSMYTTFIDTISSTGFIRSDASVVQTTTTQFDGISIFCSTATITGTYAVYGFTK